eukprot:CAMPEP_0167822886 /NCGR_PEP_ID=MMETSP0112_2-20121227/7794_1 /TAXON_ID=91324 /ORGANISM="Lotharella globosa, Strain CCCM811" /LENGTH=373 /DNA_ID=CAMNT_0007724401 /DNA_START=14 /DNA_END=1135 /DNA_ORIENTATION=+
MRGPQLALGVFAIVVLCGVIFHSDSQQNHLRSAVRSPVRRAGVLSSLPCRTVRTQAKFPSEVRPLTVLKGMGAVLVASIALMDPASAAVKKAAPILAQNAAPMEIAMDEEHGMDGMIQRINGWDTDKNGRISRKEFEKGMQDYVPHELSPGQLEQAWQRIQGVELDRRATDPSFAGNVLTDAQKQLPQPGQPVSLPTDRVTSNIPKSDGSYYQYPSPQQAYNAMVRKGKDPDIYRAKDFVSTHNVMNERGWNQVLAYESVTHPECPKERVKLAKFNGDYDGRVKGSFDRHYWTVSRCETDTQVYVLDYFDTKKFDEITMPYSNDDIEIRVQPEPGTPAAAADMAKHKKATGKVYGSTGDFDFPVNIPDPYKDS